MSTTKLIPSRPLLRYLNEKIWNTSTRQICYQVTQQPSTNSLRRSILLRPPQQCRHIIMSRISERAYKGKLMADNYKILDYDTYSKFRKLDFDSQRIILWREAHKRPGSKQHIFEGVMTMKKVMEEYLCDRENSKEDPGEGTSWMLVPKIGYDNTWKGSQAALRKIVEHINEADAKNLHEYLLVKRKSWMIPKPKQQSKLKLKPKGGRGNAKLIHIHKYVDGSGLSVLLAKAYHFLESESFNTEFHIHFTNDRKYDEESMLKELIEMPGGLALHPQVIQRQLPKSTKISINPMSNGRELVWVVARNETKYLVNDGLVSDAKKELAKLEVTPEFVIQKGKEMRKDRKWRLKEDAKEIERLKEEGKSFEHVLQRQSEITMHEEHLKAMFKEVRMKFRKRKNEEKTKKLARRLRARAHKGQEQMQSDHWESNTEEWKVARAESDEPDASRGLFVATRNASKAEQRAESESTTVDYYLDLARIETKPREESSSGEKFDSRREDSGSGRESGLGREEFDSGRENSGSRRESGLGREEFDSGKKESESGKEESELEREKSGSEREKSGSEREKSGSEREKSELEKEESGSGKEELDSGRPYRRVRLVPLKETARDEVKKAFLLRSPRPATPTIARIISQQSAISGRGTRLREQRKLDVMRSRARIRSKLENMI